MSPIWYQASLSIDQLDDVIEVSGCYQGYATLVREEHNLSTLAKIDSKQEIVDMIVCMEEKMCQIEVLARLELH